MYPSGRTRRVRLRSNRRMERPVASRRGASGARSPGLSGDDAGACAQDFFDPKLRDEERAGVGDIGRGMASRVKVLNADDGAAVVRLERQMKPAVLDDRLRQDRQRKPAIRGDSRRVSVASTRTKSTHMSPDSCAATFGGPGALVARLIRELGGKKYSQFRRCSPEPPCRRRPGVAMKANTPHLEPVTRPRRQETAMTRTTAPRSTDLGIRSAAPTFLVSDGGHPAPGRTL